MQEQRICGFTLRDARISEGGLLVVEQEGGRAVGGDDPALGRQVAGDGPADVNDLETEHRSGSQEQCCQGGQEDDHADLALDRACCEGSSSSGSFLRRLRRHEPRKIQQAGADLDAGALDGGAVASGSNVLIAEVQNCQGVVLPPNQVLYPNGFTDFKADALYK